MTFTRRYCIASLFILSGAITLLSLGVWQLQRLEWKNVLIDTINTEYNKPATELPLSFQDILSIPKWSIRYGSLTGDFLYADQVLYGPKTYEGAIGYHVITPLKMKGGIVLINRGWIAQENKNTIPPAPTTTIIGLIREPDWNSFTPNNNPETETWTKLDISQIAKEKNLTPVAPVMLYALRSDIDTEAENTVSKIIPLEEKWYPRNNHLQYAVFWFGMAFIFIGFFAIYSLKTARQK